MTGLDLFFTLLGAGYATAQVMRFAFRLDGGDHHDHKGKARSAAR